MYGDIKATELKKELEINQNAVVIDVRSAGELRSGTIPGAIHIDLFSPGFIEKIKVLDKNLTYYIICHSGNRSDSVAGAMANMGFSKVFNVAGGIMRWDGDLEYPKPGQMYRSA